MSQLSGKKVLRGREGKTEDYDEQKVCAGQESTAGVTGMFPRVLLF